MKNLTDFNLSRAQKDALESILVQGETVTIPDIIEASVTANDPRLLTSGEALAILLRLSDSVEMKLNTYCFCSKEKPFLTTPFKDGFPNLSKCPKCLDHIRHSLSDTYLYAVIADVLENVKIE